MLLDVHTVTSVDASKVMNPDCVLFPDNKFSTTDWTLQLKRTRIERNSLLSKVDDTDDKQLEGNINNSFYLHFHSLKDVILHELLTVTKTKMIQDGKKLRSILRVALCCLSIPSNRCKELRIIIQRESYDAWHECLLRLIILSSTEKIAIDDQCRLLAAQILCNLITDCTDTAFLLMDRLLSAPSDKSATSSIIRKKFLHDNEISPSDFDLLSIDTTITVCWVDLLLACTASRPLLAVVVATLHNCICSITSSTKQSDRNQDGYKYCEKLVTIPLLIATLLRHVVSAHMMHQQLKKQTVDSSNATDDTLDDATEWIGFTISKICCLGMLQQMYQSLGRDGDNNNNHNLDFVYPEHIVLLHLIRNTVEENACSGTDSATAATHKARCYRLGGDSQKENGQSIIDTHIFLTGLYIQLRESLAMTMIDENESLQVSAQQLVLDILAESLSDDYSITARIRSVLGTDTSILQSVVTDLAVTLDDWYKINKSSYARDQTKLNDIDQCRMTTIVRLIGNLCFNCRQNQDLLRVTKVPYKTQTDTVDTTSRFTATSPSKMDRNGLHVLLSTTSMSYVCFTLREWAVVAIRSALEGCIENQAIVAELEAQSSMHTAELEEMGIRVNLNVADGSVTVDQLKDVVDETEVKKLQ